MKSTLLFAVVTGLFITGAAFAQSSPAPAPTPEHGAKMQQHFDQHFSKADKNNDGFIDREEVSANKRLSQHFDEIDSNKDGKISKDELKAHFAAAHAKSHEKFDAKFKAADTNGDDALSKDEVQAANMPHLMKNFDAIDTNKDGKITQDELRTFMKSKHKDHASAQ